MNAETIARVVSGSGRRIGIERLSAHDLRRTHITLALNSGAPLPDMQAQAGHANAATTLLYARPPRPRPGGRGSLSEGKSA